MNAQEVWETIKKHFGKLENVTGVGKDGIKAIDDAVATAKPKAKAKKSAKS